MSYRACRAGLQWTWPWLAPPPSYVLRGWKEASQQRTWLCFEHFEAFVWFPVFYLRDLRNNPRLVPATSLLVLLLPMPLLPRDCPPDLPHGCKGLTMDQQLPRKQGRRQSKAVTSSPPGTSPQRATSPGPWPVPQPSAPRGWGAAGNCPLAWWHPPCRAHSSARTGFDSKANQNTRQHGITHVPLMQTHRNTLVSGCHVCRDGWCSLHPPGKGDFVLVGSPSESSPTSLLGPCFRVLEGFAHGDEQAILKNSLKNKTETL